jgi:hypothetical protein
LSPPRECRIGTRDGATGDNDIATGRDSVIIKTASNANTADDTAAASTAATAV